MGSWSECDRAGREESFPRDAGSCRSPVSEEFPLRAGRGGNFTLRYRTGYPRCNVLAFPVRNGIRLQTWCLPHDFPSVATNVGLQEFRSIHNAQRATRERLCASRGLTRPAAPERGPGRTCSRISRSPIRHASAATTAGLRLSSTMPQRHDHGVSTMGRRSRTRPATFSPPTRYDLSPRETNGRAWVWRRGHSCS